MTLVLNQYVVEGRNELALSWKGAMAKERAAEEQQQAISTSVVLFNAGSRSETTIAEQEVEVSNPSDAHVDHSSRDVIQRVVFILPEFPVKLRAWTEPLGRPISDADEEAIKARALSLVTAYQGHDLKTIGDLYSYKEQNASDSLGVNPTSLRRSREAFLNRVFADRSFQFESRSANDLTLLPISHHNLVTVTGTGGKPVVDGHGDRSHLQSNLVFAFLNHEWTLVE